MAGGAKVTSIEAIEDFAAALRNFQHEAAETLDTLARGAHRVVQWVQQDQKQYWTQQLRRSDQKLQEAKVNLQRCLTFKRIGDHRPACVEEKQAVERAKRRMQVCQEKLEAVRKWSQAIEQAVFEYTAGVGPLKQWTETDSERALALLKRIGRTLEEYLAVETAPQAAEALARLPWTDEEWEAADGEEGAGGEEATAEKAGAAEVSGVGEDEPQEEKGA